MRHGREIFQKLRENKVRVAGGNAAVLQKVESGEVDVGVLLLESALVAPDVCADLADLHGSAPDVVARLFPAQPELYARRGWRMFPEIDRVEWVSPDQARLKLNPAQGVFVDRLEAHLGPARGTMR